MPKKKNKPKNQKNAKEVLVEGKSVEEAMVKAANELKVAVGSLEYEVVKKTSGAFFGLFGSSKVEVSVKFVLPFVRIVKFKIVFELK